MYAIETYHNAQVAPPPLFHGELMHFPSQECSAGQGMQSILAAIVIESKASVETH
jgi:hypothetical protein